VSTGEQRSASPAHQAAAARGEGPVALADRIRARVRDVPDFPTPGILFKDITPVLADAPLFHDLIAHFRDHFARVSAEAVVAIESRGFIVGAPIALALGAAFVPVRKPGKLPARTVRVDYQLEYGTDALEAHVDSIHQGQRVLVIDDVLATGGTAAGTVELVRKLGGNVIGCGFVIELGFLGGRGKLPGITTDSIVVY
jgi:adenine phosphoribosyltransferase